MGGEGGRVSRGGGRSGQSGCERRIEAFVKIQKKNIFFVGLGGGVGSGRVREGVGRGRRVEGSGWM